MSIDGAKCYLDFSLLEMPQMVLLTVQLISLKGFKHNLGLDDT